MTKAYSYLRFSTPEQRKGDSSRRQTQLAEAYATRHGLTLDDQLTYQDLGVSAFRGKHAQKGSLKDFLDAVQAKQVEPGSYLLVENLDRISRQQQWDAVQTMGSIVQAGITLVTLAPERQISRATLNTEPFLLMEVILGFQRANEESATKARRIKAAWSAKRDKATEQPMTSTAPAWLTLNKAKGKWIVDKARAAVVRRIYRDAARGIGQNSIAEALNREGVEVFGSAQFWQRSYVVKILDSPAVIGEMLPHEWVEKDGVRQRKAARTKPISGYYPRIVEDDLYQQVRALRRVNYETGKRATKAPLRGKHAAAGEVRNVFGGLLVCPLCGSTVTRVSKGSGPKGGAYLVCTRAKIGAGCTYKAIRYEQVEDALIAGAKALIGAAPAGGSGTLDQDLERAENTLEATQDAIENVLRAIEKGGKSVALTSRLHELEAGREKARKTVDGLTATKTRESGKLVAARLSELRDVLTTAPLDRMRANALLRQVFASITLDYRSGTLDFTWQHGGESSLVYAWPDGAGPGRAGRQKERSLSPAIGNVLRSPRKKR